MIVIKLKTNEILTVKPEYTDSKESQVFNELVEQFSNNKFVSVELDSFYHREKQIAVLANDIKRIFIK